MTMLHRAMQLVSSLLSEGADPNALISIENDNSYTPLHLACLQGLESIIDLLLDKVANLNAQTDVG